METGKHSNSYVSSPENDQKPEDTTGIGRSYECTFCKRGFTNAQALGGHMNIHRKDKAKAKQQKKYHEGSSTIDHNVIKPNENYPNYLRYFPQTDHHHQLQTSYYKPVKYQVYLPSSNPSFETENNCVPIWRAHIFESDRVDASLSLRIGPVEDGDEDHGILNKDEVEVDLELRLGHDH